VGADKAPFRGQLEHTKPMLQWGREEPNAEWLVPLWERCHCNDDRLGPPSRLAVRIVHLTAEPLCRARRQNGANAGGIESLQQSVLISRSPGLLLFVFAMQTRNHGSNSVSIPN
jgi:hypothetical protein